MGKPKEHPGHSAKQLREMIPRIVYEAQQLHRCDVLFRMIRQGGIQVKVSEPEIRCLLHDCLLEAALLHARVLHEFFDSTVRKKEGDIIAADYTEFERPKALKKILPDGDRVAINQWLAHLTTERLKEKRGWAVAEYARQMRRWMRAFLHALRKAGQITEGQAALYSMSLGIGAHMGDTLLPFSAFGVGELTSPTQTTSKSPSTRPIDS